MRLLALLCLAACAAAEDPFVRTIALPVRDGQVATGALVAAMADAAGLHGSWLAGLPGSLPADGALAALGRLLVERGTQGAIALRRHDDVLDIVVDRLATRRHARAAQAAVRAWVARVAPGEAHQAALAYGLFLVGDDGAAPLPAAGAPARLVVLVHGLDEPGHCWDAVHPALRADGHAVALYRYPNDQPVEASATMLANNLLLARRAGTTTIDLVAHSMGGLVCRELLTAPALYGGSGAGGEARPTVRRLITVATPHHGSTLARWRLAAEARDHLSRALSGQGLLFGALLDGCGEAQEDLTPGSPFLVALAARPLPTGIAITTVAGDRSPVSAEGIVLATDTLAGRLPALQPSLQDLRDTLAALADGHGDGAVALESARWPGVDDHIVLHANHLTLLGPPLPGVAGEAAALATIRDRLGRTP